MLLVLKQDSFTTCLKNLWNRKEDSLEVKVKLGNRKNLKSLIFQGTHFRVLNVCPGKMPRQGCHYRLGV